MQKEKDNLGMSYEWYEVPVRVIRCGNTLVVPANKVENGDVIFGTDGCSHITAGFWPDDEEEVAYLAINNGLDHWPVSFFMSE